MPPALATDDLVFASLPLALIAYCTTLGIDPRDAIAIAGLRSEDLRDPDALVEYESLIRLWAVMLARFPGRPLGLDYASYLTPRSLGVLGYACSHCRDLGGAIELYARYCRLADPHLCVSIERSEGQARVALTHEPRVEAMAEPIEMMLAALAYTSRRMNPSMPPPHEVCFHHPQRHLLPPTRRCSRPRCGSRPASPASCSPRPRSRCRSSGPISSWASTCSSRSRRSTGTSFSEQLDAVRRARALQLLRAPDLSVREIAFILGYADPRAFYRSFRRWTGHTPAEHRRPR